MKFIYAVSAFVAVAAAQDISSLPACGQKCVNNMLALAGSLGCSATDAKCLCGNANFGHGLNDCSLEACGAAVQAQVVAFGSTYCTNAGASIAGVSGGASTTGTAVVTGSAASAASSASGAVNSAASSVSAGLASVASSISGQLASASSSAASALSSASAGASNALSSAVSGASSAASSATSSGFAMKTAAPFAGAGALGALAMMLV